MFYKARVKQFAIQALTHTQTNAAIYITLIGALAQKEFPTVLTCLKVLGLRAVAGAIRNRFTVCKKEHNDQISK